MSSLNARSGWRYREDEKIHSSHTKSIEHRRVSVDKCVTKGELILIQPQADVVNLSSHRPEVHSFTPNFCFDIVALTLFYNIGLRPC